MNRNALRFSIAFILFVCLCVAGSLAGYRAGFSEGYASGKAKRQSEEPFAKVYEVGDLIRATAVREHSEAVGDQLDFQSLIDAAQTTVLPDEWESLGGPCSMAPLPWLESLAVHATSDVHDGLEAFFTDLSKLRIVVAEARKDNEARQQARDARVKRMLEPVAKRLGERLSPLAADFDVIGSWDVQRHTADTVAEPLRYTFVDESTVAMASSIDAQELTETWYSRSPASMVIAGTGYVAASTAKRHLVLIPYQDTETFLVAEKVEGESSEAPESSK